MLRVSKEGYGSVIKTEILGFCIRLSKGNSLKMRVESPSFAVLIV